jgi:cytochrome c biogenesis protein CcdA
MGSLDGFNPCAMWALLFLITLLLGMENRKRMWILGIAFIITSALVYFLFMTAWLKLILFIGIIFWIRILIGAIAIGGGSYNLKEYFTNKEGACKVTNNQRRREIFEKLKKITQHQSFYWALGGIILLAFAVNLVELICSAGLPAVYTQILTLSELATWQYYMYLILYILFFMIDDLFVFFVSMKTLQVTGITTKYSRWSHLIGGILMIIIGLLLIFKHEWLMFG